MLTTLLDHRTDPRHVALARIGIGIGALILALESFSILTVIAGPEILDIQTVDAAPTITPGLVITITAVWAAAAILLIFGRYARTAAAVTGLCGALTLTLDQQLFSNHLLLMTALCLLLMGASPAAAWSLDARHRPMPATIPTWPVALLISQLVTLYLYAALSKTNASFLAGDVIATATHDYIPMTPRLAQLAAVGTVAAELFLPIALLTPRLRPAAFPIGLALHTGILIAVRPAGALLAFGILTLSTYVLFLRPAPRTVIWDDTCTFCRRSVGVFRRLDWLETSTYIGSSDPDAYMNISVTRAQAQEALQVVVDGRRYAGYDAVRVMLEGCPLTFLAAPILRLPPFRVVGSRIYRRVARSRSCAVGVTLPSCY